MESLGQADYKTVPGFEFRATFEGDIKGFTLVKVMVATTVCSEENEYEFGQNSPQNKTKNLISFEKLSNS